jgi:hypothetical protein
LSDASVELRLSSLLRVWRALDHSELWVEFVPRIATDDALRAVDRAVKAANGDAASAGHESRAEGVSPSDRGVGIFLSRTGDPDDVERWLRAFAASLAIQGTSGTVKAPPRDPDWPRWIEWTTDYEVTLIASVRSEPAETSEGSRNPMIWSALTTSTAELTHRAAQWAKFEGAEVTLTRNIMMLRTQAPNIGALLADGLRRTRAVGLHCFSRDEQRMRACSFAAPNSLVIQEIDRRLTPAARVRDLLEPLLPVAPLLDVAFVTYAPSVRVTGPIIAGLKTRFPNIQSYHWSQAETLHGLFLPDAFGAQILSGAHVAKARDLSRWTVSNLGNDRFLVETSDLGTWYAADEPPRDLLQRARADFGDMIVRPEVLPDWMRGGL